MGYECGMINKKTDCIRVAFKLVYWTGAKLKMNYYERLFEYISNQIYNIFTILFGGINTIPNYTISFNIQQGNWGKKFNL